MKLTEWTSCGGCAAKWGGSPLRDLLRGLGGLGGPDGPHGPDGGGNDPRLLVGLAPFDDAAVYRLGPEVALVSTTDFFPPLVDDPADFGAIAAANACSDVFAMGGRVVLALNVAAFPEEFPTDAIATILAAAAEVVRMAGGAVAGGHTIRSPEPIFGLAVQGVVHPDRIWEKGGALPGDHLMLSKPIGGGIVLAGGTDDDKVAAVAVMRTLNSTAADQLRQLATPHAVTDVTGFGLAGHAWEMAERGQVVMRVAVDRVPLYQGAMAAASAGVRTGGDARNRAYLGGRIRGHVDADLEALVIDPQTSGGLLAAVSPDDATRLTAAGWWEIGGVEAGEPAVVLVAGEDR
jgi:selenide,water dikinase